MAKELEDNITSNSQYDNLRNESYRAMLNSEIQASLARDQALKYTQNQLNAQGMGNQGMSESARAGIYNTYQNALGTAANTYRSNLIDIADKEQNSLSGNYETASNYLNNAFTYDADGKVTGVDLDKYRNTLKTFGVDTSDVNNLDFSNSKFSDKDRLDLQENYRQLLETYGENGEVEAPKPYATGDAIKDKGARVKMANGLGDVTFINKSGTNKDFLITIDNNTFRVEMGGKLGKYNDGLDPATAKEKYANKQIGDVFVHDAGNGNYFLCVVDQNKDIRVIEHSARGGAGTNKKLAEYFGLGKQRTTAGNVYWTIATGGLQSTGARKYKKYDETKDKSKNK